MNIKLENYVTDLERKKEQLEKDLELKENEMQSFQVKREDSYNTIV